jgi:hypothetical protein
VLGLRVDPVEVTGDGAYLGGLHRALSRVRSEEQTFQADPDERRAGDDRGKLNEENVEQRLQGGVGVRSFAPEVRVPLGGCHRW